MLFNSIEFIAFFVVVTHLFYVLPHRFRWMMLLAASCIFYMAFVPVYILILFGTIVIDYFAGLLLEKTEGRKRHLFLVMSLVANIGILVVFKYYNFFIDNINQVTSANLPFLRILLPIGLSFHTFQAMSYTIEVYRGNQRAERHFGIYALYVMFYPQLVAGPIERPQNILHQFYIHQRFNYANVVNGLKLMAWGMFKKVVIADRLALFVDQVFNNPDSYEGIPVIIAAVFFSFQIYFDFSGYSDIAIGSAKTMGFELMTNFDRPYLSLGIAEFWKRWHISLSSWFRDYVYIPMGGNRVSKLRSYFNQFFVFLLSGFWHGANWTFILWGALHGTYVFLERIFAVKLPVPKLFRRLFLFFCVTVAWVFFRADSVHTAFELLGRATHVGGQAMQLMSNMNMARLNLLYLNISKLDFMLSLALIAFVLAIEYFQRQRSFLQFIHGLRPVFRWSFYCILIYGCILLGVFQKTQFIYFQF